MKIRSIYPPPFWWCCVFGNVQIIRIGPEKRSKSERLTPHFKYVYLHVQPASIHTTMYIFGVRRRLNEPQQICIFALCVFGNIFFVPFLLFFFFFHSLCSFSLTYGSCCQAAELAFCLLCYYVQFGSRTGQNHDSFFCLYNDHRLNIFLFFRSCFLLFFGRVSHRRCVPFLSFFSIHLSHSHRRYSRAIFLSPAFFMHV